MSAAFEVGEGYRKGKVSRSSTGNGVFPSTQKAGASSEIPKRVSVSRL